MPKKSPGLIRQALWKYRRWTVIGVGALALVDLLEVIPPALLKRSIDVVTEGRALTELKRVALLYVLVAVFQAIGRYGWRMYLIRTSMLASRDLRDRFARHLFGLSASFFDRHRVGDLMSLATSDVEAVRMMIGAGFLILMDAIFYFITVPVAMYLLSPRLTLLALLPLPLIPWIVWRNEREIHARHEKLQQCFGELSSQVQEGLSGVRVTRAFAREDVQIRRLREKGEEYGKLHLKLARVQTAFGPTLDFAMSLGLVSLLWFGGRGAVSLGTFVAFQRYIQKMVWPMAALGMSLGYYQRSVSSSERLQEIFDQRTDVPDPPASARFEGPGPRKVRGEVEFDHLSFKYPGATGESRPALTEITFRIEAGERVALLGAVGAGKSSLLRLIPRLYPVARGMLRVDGIDVNDWTQAALRGQLGYVSQDVFLFGESVLENVAFGLSSAMQPVVEESTRAAAIHDEILVMPRQYETRLGERGVNLSGGQKQRLTIARAVAKKPAILILDDALSSVDVRTEELILNQLRGASPEAERTGTEILAAHRISTLQRSDRVVVLSEGRIAQIGSPVELLRQKGGLYWRFHEQQRLQQELEGYAARLDEAPEGLSS